MPLTVAQAIDAEESRLIDALRLNPSYQRLRAVQEARRVLKDTEITQTARTGAEAYALGVWPGGEDRRALNTIEPGPEQIDRPPVSICTVRVTLDMIRAGADELQSSERTSRSRMGDVAVVFWAMINAFPGGPRRWQALWVAAENDPKCVSITNWEGESNGRRS